MTTKKETNWTFIIGRIHEEAMGQRVAGNIQEAYELDKVACALIKNKKDLDLTRAVIFRSAADLAMRLGLKSEVSRLCKDGLFAKYVPDEISPEFALMLQWAGDQEITAPDFDPDDPITGLAVNFGFILQGNTGQNVIQPIRITTTWGTASRLITTILDSEPSLDTAGTVSAIKSALVEASKAQIGQTPALSTPAPPAPPQEPQRPPVSQVVTDPATVDPSDGRHYVISSGGRRNVGCVTGGVAMVDYKAKDPAAVFQETTPDQCPLCVAQSKQQVGEEPGEPDPSQASDGG